MSYAVDTEDSIVVESQSPEISASVAPTISSTPSASSTPTANITTISYTATGYTPATVTIKKGDTITFVNNSTKEMWPASAVHPSHSVYPEQKNCFAGVFKDCRVAVGGSFSMKFNVVGAWGFHDHVSPNLFGKITVTE